MMKSKIPTVLIFLVLLGGFLRMYNLNWDQGLFLHPDERLFVNASNLSMPKTLAEFLSPFSPLNPHMFYYGSFSLYIYKICSLLSTTISFLLMSRFISSLFSTLTIICIYLLAKQFFTKKTALFAAFVFTFSVGSIQHAHFNTTESLLTFLITLITYLSILAFQKRSLFLFFVIGLLCGISYATKITGLTFLLSPAVAIVMLFLQKKSWGKIVFILLLISFGTLLTGVLFAPYQIIDFTTFSQQQTYMQGVTYGTYKPPFVIIYEHTPSYIYPLIKILPFIFGFISLPLALLGLIMLLQKISFKSTANFSFLFLLTFPLVYFAWAGNWYAKFSRYYMLLLPFLSIWASLFISTVSKKIVWIVIFGIVLNGTLYMNVYVSLHTRIAASHWIYQNIPAGSVLAGEHWDDNLPLPVSPSQSPAAYQQLQLPVYDRESIQKTEQLAGETAASDYVILSSRRVYASILSNKDLYPTTNLFYKKLFNGELGFIKIKEFTNYPFFFSDDFADETFQSYDHPPVLIFKNIKKLGQEEILHLL